MNRFNKLVSLNHSILHYLLLIYYSLYTTPYILLLIYYSLYTPSHKFLSLYSVLGSPSRTLWRLYRLHAVEIICLCFYPPFKTPPGVISLALMLFSYVVLLYVCLICCSILLSLMFWFICSCLYVCLIGCWFFCCYLCLRLTMVC